MDSSIIGKMMQFAGLVGGFPTNSLIPRRDSPLTRDVQTREFNDAGSVSDPNMWAAYNRNMSQPVTYENMLQLWDQMSSWDLIAAILLEIVDEATQTDASSPGLLWYECSDSKVEDELNNMLSSIGAEALLPSQFWHVAGFGNAFEKLDYANGEGILGLSYVHPMEMRRYWLTRNRRCIGFKWNGHEPDKTPAYIDKDGHEIPRVGLGTGGQNVENLYYPWDFLHFRRMYRMRMSEHGEPIFAEAQGIYKKLRMAIDQMVVYRSQIQPDRFAINIDVQDQTPTEQMKTVQRWKQSLRRRLSFGDASESGQATDFNSFYSPLSLDSILWIAQPRGFAHAVNKIPGTESVPDIYDIEMLINLFFAVIGMPKWWIMGQGNGGGDSGNPASGRALMATDMRFMRKIKGIRQPVTTGYEWLAYFHALLRGHNLADLDITVKMPDIGSLEDQVKMEILNAQTDVMVKLADVMDKFQLPHDIWIDLIFRRYLKMPDDVVDLIITSLPPESQSEALKAKRNAPKTSAVITEIEAILGRDKSFKRKLDELSYGERNTRRCIMAETRRKQRQYGTPAAVLGQTKLQENDTIVSSMGLDPMQLSKNTSLQESTTGAPSISPIFEAMIKHDETSKKEAKDSWRKFISSDKQ